MATTPKEMGAQALETSSGTKMGSMMWARMPPKHEEQYEKGAVVEASSGTKVKVKLPDGSVEEYSINDLLPCNTESDLEDVCALTYLSEAAVLDCVRVRFLKKKIYTWTARILIAMNPFERLPIYGTEFMVRCPLSCASRGAALSSPVLLSPVLPLATRCGARERANRGRRARRPPRTPCDDARCGRAQAVLGRMRRAPHHATPHARHREIRSPSRQASRESSARHHRAARSHRAARACQRRRSTRSSTLAPRRRTSSR